MYLLKLSLRPWRIAPLSQLFSGIAVGFLLLIVGFLFWMQQGLKTVLTRLQGEQVVTAYIDSSVEVRDELKILERIKATIDFQNPPEVKLVTAPEFVNSMKKHYPELGRELEGLGKDSQQVVPRYISISGIFSDSLLETVKSIPGVEYAESSKDRYRHVTGAFSSLRWVVRILMGGVCLTLLTGLIHLSRMNAYLHQDALRLLRFWGANQRVLSSPGMISGLMVGVLGGMIAWAGWITFGAWLAQHIQSLSAILKWMPPVQGYFALTLFVFGALVGLIAGAMGSFSISYVNHDGGTGG